MEERNLLYFLRMARPGPTALRCLLRLTITLVAACGTARAAACPTLTMAWVPPYTQVNRTSYPGGNTHGLEDGIVVRRADGGLTMLSAEPYTEPYAVAMQLGVYAPLHLAPCNAFFLFTEAVSVPRRTSISYEHRKTLRVLPKLRVLRGMTWSRYTSLDGLEWRRQRTLRVSTGELGTDSLHAAHWGPLLTKNGANNTWLLSYVGYKAAKSNASGFLANYQGTIFSRYATTAGDEGLDSDFGEASILPC